MKIALTVLGIIYSIFLYSQAKTDDLIQSVENKSLWKYYNRSPAFIMKEQGKIYSLMLNSVLGDGLAVYQDLEFENGILEFDIKGKDVLQQSFVGIAFHIQNDSSFNAIYFRPFNFKKPERASHSVQYISHPKFTWQKLRTEFPEQFEKSVNPVPNPDDFFHAKVEVKWPLIKVFVENSKTPSLEVKMLSTFRKGQVGFWVGNGSDGEIKNLVVTKL